MSLSLREQSRRDHAKRRKNLKEIKEEEKRKVTTLKLKALLILNNFRTMYLENPCIFTLLKHYFSNHTEIENKEEFTNNLLKGDMMLLTEMGHGRLVTFVNDFS